MRVKLLGSAAIPTASEKENNRGSFIRCLMPFGIKNVELQINLPDLLVGDFFAWLGSSASQGRQNQQAGQADQGMFHTAIYYASLLFLSRRHSNNRVRNRAPFQYLSLTT